MECWQHVFKRDADDEKELNISGLAEAAEHELSANDSGQKQVWLAARVYADAAREQGPRPGSRSVDQDSSTANIVSASDIILSDVTAARYKEYNVVKINKRGVCRPLHALRRSTPRPPACRSAYRLRHHSLLCSSRTLPHHPRPHPPRPHHPTP